MLVTVWQAQRAHGFNPITINKKSKIMKKILTLLALVALAIATVSCKEKDKTIYVENVVLDKTNALLYVGNILTLSASIFPYNVTNKAMSWSSSDIAVATVDSNIVTAIWLGETTITVTTQDGNKTATCDVIVTMPAIGARCNGNLPGWGASLGTVSFVSDGTWVVSNGIIVQEWSDAVTATNCNKEIFSGRSMVSMSFNADCRSNPGQKGDLFSWCAVARFKDILCPAPWRVPTKEDFINLDIALGGTGENRIGDTNFLFKYIDRNWGGSYSGACLNTGELSAQNLYALYWSQTVAEENDRCAHRIELGGNNNKIWLTTPSASNLINLHIGLALRCVRD
jgi:uncharacterized protein (TIGR02145 family)